MSKRQKFATLIFILAIGAFFRFYQITEVPPGLYPDEAMNGNNALEAIATGDFKVFYPENNGREGLFINLQALSLRLFGIEPWALRIVSAIFGTLTILGVYLLTKELFGQSHWLRNTKEYEITKNNLSYFRTNSYFVALLSSFFLATSYWHINFSRIGFRAIMIPFLATFGIYFLLKGLRQGKILDMVWAGIFIGLGFHTYIAFRFIPFVLAVPLIWYLWKWWKNTDTNIRMNTNYTNKYCAPCAVLLFFLITFVVALPLGLHFVQNPQDFLGRAGDVSIFSSISPLKEFIKSNLATLGMFFIRGDCNWRHNFACQPQLQSVVAIFFLTGFILMLRQLFFRATSYKLQTTSLLAWLLFMSLPATLTREGLPHALRSIGLIPPVMILSGLGAWWIYQKIINWLDLQKLKWPTYIGQLERVKKEVALLAILLLTLIPILTYRNYFIRWAGSEETYFAFSTDLWHLGKFLDGLPNETKKYVVVNLPGVEVRGISVPAQTVMFATDTFRETGQKEKNMEYVLPQNISNQLLVTSNQPTVIAFLNGEDKALINEIKQKNPQLRVRVPGDFVILEN
ncbi:MAG: glycosyltransferase family 39 protein [Candidatus Sungbacteria bacterium]|nr:glycosyltransferase family 39 protein [Candidatus Sungbacteria bacterium]